MPGTIDKPTNPNIGAEVIMRQDEFLIRMKVLDAWFTCGHYDYKVTPITGSGEKWVRETRLVFPYGQIVEAKPVKAVAKRQRIVRVKTPKPVKPVRGLAALPAYSPRGESSQPKQSGEFDGLADLWEYRQKRLNAEAGI